MKRPHGAASPAARICCAFRAREKRLELGRRTAVMGVVNVTQDSFFAGSRFPDSEKAVARALEMARSGADIIDIGGESTRPGATPVPPAEELSRILPVISELVLQTDVLISVDTRKAATAEKALEMGADLVNDVSGLSDPSMAQVVSDAGGGLVLMHMKGTPETMQKRPYYEDVVLEIKDFLARTATQAEAAGVAPDSIIVDPGIGFGKNVAHNLRIINRLHELSSLEKPILVGPSRKSFLGHLLDLLPEDRLLGTAATVAVSILRGAHIVRVHDVVETLQVARTADAIMSESSVIAESGPDGIAASTKAGYPEGAARVGRPLASPRRGIDRGGPSA